MADRNQKKIHDHLAAMRIYYEPNYKPEGAGALKLTPEDLEPRRETLVEP